MHSQRVTLWCHLQQLASVTLNFTTRLFSTSLFLFSERCSPFLLGYCVYTDNFWLQRGSAMHHTTKRTPCLTLPSNKLHNVSAEGNYVRLQTHVNIFSTTKKDRVFTAIFAQMMIRMIHKMAGRHHFNLGRNSALCRLACTLELQFGFDKFLTKGPSY
jgi:hypothetical protein